MLEVVLQEHGRGLSVDGVLVGPRGQAALCLPGRQSLVVLVHRNVVHLRELPREGSNPRGEGALFAAGAAWDAEDDPFDLLGLDARFQPRFARRYMDGQALVRDAINRYAQDVRAAEFPAPAEVLA